MKKPRFLPSLVALALVLVPLQPFGADEMRSLLSQGNERLDTLLFGLKLNTRLDMIDYFDAGSDVFSADDVYRSEIRINALEDRHVGFATATPLTIDTYFLSPGADSLLVSVVSTGLGNGDTIVRVGDIRTGKAIRSISPTYSEWIDKEAAQKVSETELLAFVPFITADASVDPQECTVTLTNTAVIVPGIDERITGAFRKTLIYKWNGDRFVFTEK